MFKEFSQGFVYFFSVSPTLSESSERVSPSDVLSSFETITFSIFATLIPYILKGEAFLITNYLAQECEFSSLGLQVWPCFMLRACSDLEAPNKVFMGSVCGILIDLNMSLIGCFSKCATKIYRGEATRSIRSELRLLLARMAV